MAIELVPPQDIEAEASCLSSALLSRDALLKVIEILQPEDFYLDSHREIFGVIVELERKNLPIDLVTVKQRLNDLGRFERIGASEAERDALYEELGLELTLEPGPTTPSRTLTSGR